MKTGLFALLLVAATLADNVLPPDTPYCEACDKTDLIFILDASQSIPENNYQAEINFIKNITSESTTNFPKWGDEIGETVQVGVYVFKGVVESHLDFMADNSVQTLQNYLNSIKAIQTSGTSNLCTPMNDAQQEFQNFGREGVPKTLVIFTDGDPNSASGTCSPNIAVQLANTMKNSYSVEILCIAVAGNNGYQPVSNMPFLQQIASKQTINGVPTPLVWSLSDPNALNGAMQSIISRMSCCSCYPDMVHTVETDDWTDGGGSFLKNIFQNINNVANYWLGSSVPGGTQSLVIMTDNKNTSAVITGATDYTSWYNQIKAQCPRALSGNEGDPCKWLGGFADITAGLEETKQLLVNSHNTFVNSAPDASMMHITGGCLVGTDSSGCSSNSINAAIQAYQNAYKLRIGDFLQIGNSSSRSMLQQIVGSDYTIVDGPGTQGQTVIDNDQCLTYQMQRAFSDVPGCSAQPYLDSGFQNSCGGLIH